MPNWCYNNINITHENPEMMQRLVTAFKEGNFLNEFIPCPKELLDDVEIGENYHDRRSVLEAANLEKYGHTSWYTWRIENWGTKWEVSEGELDYDPDTNSASGYFDTAWSPPVTAMETLTDLGFIVELQYQEEGIGFVGEYNSEDGDNCYDLDFENEDWRDGVPDHLIEQFNLDEEYENWLEFNSEQEEDDNS